MKQAEFYRCIKSGDQCYALRTLGYAEGGIGLVKETKERGWVATHISTGVSITPNISNHKTAKQALSEAEHLIASSENILESIRKVRSSKGYDCFLTDRHQQLMEQKL